MYAELKGGPFTRGGTFDISYVQTDTALEVNVKYFVLAGFSGRIKKIR